MLRAVLGAAIAQLARCPPEARATPIILAGEVVATTRMRVYVQFDRVQLPDGSWLPICGAAVSEWEGVYGIPTREGVVFPNSFVDPAKVDQSPGSVVLNDVHLLTVIEPLPQAGEEEASVRGNNWRT